MRVVLRNVCKDIKEQEFLIMLILNLKVAWYMVLRERTVLENHAYACYKRAYKSEG